MNRKCVTLAGLTLLCATTFVATGVSAGEFKESASVGFSAGKRIGIGALEEAHDTRGPDGHVTVEGIPGVKCVAVLTEAFRFEGSL